MSAEVAATDPPTKQQADEMSAVTQKSYGDLPPSIPVFSYAQAAKGRSPSVLSPLPASKARSNSAEADGKRASSSETRSPIADPKTTATKRTASEGRAPQGDDPKAVEERRQAQTVDNKDNLKAESDSEKPAVSGQSQPVVSTPSSPEYGTTSTSTLPKEEDLFSTVNGSSDSTSDKQSQTSQNGSKHTDKVDEEKRQDTSAPSWDEELPAHAPALKEAPPPPVNFWTQRSEKAKFKAPTTVPPSKPVNAANGSALKNGPAKSGETAMEPKKPDSKKKSKPAPGLTEDRSTLGAGKDSSKSADTADKTGLAPMAPPPPPGDAISWPTPDSAGTDGKKKGQDRVEKNEKDVPQTPKPHGKEKWVPVPYVPTAVFNTPLPPARRGGRSAPRGGREGETRGRNTTTAGNNADKSTLAGAVNGQASAATGQERGKAGATISATNSTTSKPKRSSSAGPSTPHEQRKSEAPTGADKRKDGEAVLPKAPTTNGSAPSTTRRPSAPATSKDSQAVRTSGSGQSNEPSWSSKTVPASANEAKKDEPEFTDATLQPKARESERRSEGSIRPVEYSRDYQGSFPSRERGEPRPDRGRGGYRGSRGGNHAFFNSNPPNGHSYTNGYASHYQQPMASPSKPHSNHERLAPQTPSSYQPAHHQNRHYRANSRSQSIPQSNPYGRFSDGHHGGPPNLPNLQTELANEYGYLPAHQGAMSAIPFNSYSEQPSVFGMVNLQMNYYFSVENLCKDLYLRKHMDSQGFVFLELLAKFNRIKQLTNDMDLIRQACLHSQTIEYAHVDGVDRVRAREGWQQWILKMEERDSSAQNDGPSLQAVPQYPQSVSYIPALEDRQSLSPRSGAIGHPVDIQYHSLNGLAPSFGQGHTTAGSNVVDASATRTPLSAAVSEFSPSVRSNKHRNFSAPDAHSQSTSVFTDAQVENLHILVRKPLNAAASAPPPFHSSSSRTFSNGSIDGRSIHDELSRFAERQSKSAINGDTSESTEANNAQRSRSPFPVGSPRQMDNNVSPPVLWIKDRQNSVDPPSFVPNDCVHESYHDFRQDALKQREQSGSGKDHNNMQSLYQFWSHFLIRNFNSRMYEEFHRLALEDATQRNSQTGMRSLMRFYDESILSQKAVSDDNIARDFIDIVKTESSPTERPTFVKLRAVWRNGAFNMRNRSKLTKFVDADLKAELER